MELILGYVNLLCIPAEKLLAQKILVFLEMRCQPFLERSFDMNNLVALERK